MSLSSFARTRLSASFDNANFVWHKCIKQYDAAGHLTQITDRNNRVTNYIYNHLGQKKQETWKDTPTGSVTHTFDYSYYLCGKLQTASDTIGSTANSSYVFSRDYMGRETAITATIAGLTPSVTLGQKFDADSNRTQLSATIGTTNDFINDYQYANNRMTQVKQSGPASGGSNVVNPKRVDMLYYNNGPIHTIARYSDLTTDASKLASTDTYTYDGASRLTGLSYNLPWVGGTDPSYTLHYEDNGRIDRFISAVDGTTAIYTYDHTNQLTGVTGDGTESYSYDDAGNRTGGSYSTIAGNRIEHDATGNLLGYDSEGNRIRKTAANGMTKSEYSYDNRNRLTQVRNYAWTGGAWVQGKTVDYRYDVFDRLVGKAVDNTHDGVVDAQDAYVYDGANAVLQFHKDGAGAMTNADLSRRFLDGPAVNQVFAEEVVGASKVRWLLGDHEGSIRDVAEYNYSTGTYTSTMVDHLDYDTFGNFTQTNANYAPTFSYTGRQYDAATQLYYYRARWYDAKSGRFLSEDPIGFAAGDANLYRYCGNSPVNFTDPGGMVPVSGGGGWAENSEPKTVCIKPVCFAAGTPVLMADGSWKRIEEIQPGDKVLSAHEYDAEGKVEAKEVLEVYHHEPRPIMEIAIEGGIIRCTPRHPFYVRGQGWTAAEELPADAQLRTHDGQWITLKEKTDLEAAEPVFNFAVAENHTYFVGNGDRKCTILVHNASGDKVLKAFVKKIAKETGEFLLDNGKKIKIRNWKFADSKVSLEVLEALTKVKKETIDWLRKKYGEMEISYNKIGQPDFTGFWKAKVTIPNPESNYAGRNRSSVASIHVLCD